MYLQFATVSQESKAGLSSPGRGGEHRSESPGTRLLGAVVPSSVVPFSFSLTMWSSGCSGALCVCPCVEAWRPEISEFGLVLYLGFFQTRWLSQVFVCIGLPEHWSVGYHGDWCSAVPILLWVWASLSCHAKLHMNIRQCLSQAAFGAGPHSHLVRWGQEGIGCIPLGQAGSGLGFLVHHELVDASPARKSNCMSHLWASTPCTVCVTCFAPWPQYGDCGEGQAAVTRSWPSAGLREQLRVPEVRAGGAGSCGDWCAPTKPDEGCFPHSRARRRGSLPQLCPRSIPVPGEPADPPPWWWGCSRWVIGGSHCR